MKKFEEILKSSLVLKGISQKELALTLGVSVHTVWRWANGTRTPDMEMLKKIASILEVSVGYLLGESDTLVEPKPLPLMQETDDAQNFSAPYEIISAITEINAALNKEGDRFSDAEAATAESLLYLCIETLKREKGGYGSQETA